MARRRNSGPNSMFNGVAHSRDAGSNKSTLKEQRFITSLFPLLNGNIIRRHRLVQTDQDVVAMDEEEPTRPQSIKEISKQAEDFHWNGTLPLKAWARTASMLEKQAGIYLQERNFGEAYMIYLRYSILYLDYLVKYPGSKTSEGKKILRPVAERLPNVLSNLEKIRPIVEKQYNEWEASEATRGKHRKKEFTKPKTPYEKHASRDPALSAKSRVLDASQNQELAVDLAQREIRKRDAARRATRQAGVSAEEEQHRRIAGFWDNWTDDLADKQTEDEQAFRRQMESTRRTGRTQDDHINDFIQRMSRTEREARPETPSRNSSTAYHYPSISKSQPVQYETLQPTRPQKEPPLQPPRPPKEDIYRSQYRHADSSLPPELPAKELIYPTPEPSQEPPQGPPELPPKISEAPAAPSPPSESLQRPTFRAAAYLENGEPIRSVFLPAQLRSEFMALAADHTRRGVEMCGLLCGTAVNNALFIRCLLIPEQKCTPDTCEMENESAMFDYCMSEDLLMLGWIHTHPTQTCFMSSRDLHTQAGYQVMLPESIAIVCAPRFEPSYGIFRLTNPPGLPHILHCTQTATFHQHSIDNLYTGAEEPAGHVYENDRLEFYVHDLRPGKGNV
ncbi:uncharacterized protein BCR38DRAFT_422604 [Pseudomassariella vexata]|uniref:MPN domain-containing protein n=1 Tax=Pseudomassariella vexata TaxID=1141098 RepID=A0A1Y2E9P3_9PEZI|nr:uncharacterized protein BCR38DRAFT_422604 [Pseudomassariella vexata]ORY68262.1 hypothetical protein BCR38DRAFT_422604 [Pseudomassariella vexata]